jgi:TolB-like protein/class 3 adenylate cyclase/tetratricopeptide (TPR) repeat protein
VPEKPIERKLAAIFAADIAGYSRLMARDEVGTLARLKACRAIVDRLIAAHRGRIFNTAGDSVVADFASAVDAVQCAVAVQAAIAAENANRDADEPMLWRIGVHVGDVMVDGANLLGDGVNIAARLEALAEPGAICVSAAAHGQIGNKLPLAFDDLGDQQVKNIAQAIRVYRVQTTLTHPAANAPGSPLSRTAGEGAERQRREAGEGSPPALALPDKPSIAVLPFQNMSGDPEQEYFADGMVEEIITALSRIRWLFVIARNSTFTYKGRAVDVKEVGRELGVRYVLEGSVRKAGTRVRITAQLIDALTGTHLWADRFDGSLEDVFELQDKVAISVAGVIEPALQAAEIRHSAARPTSDLTAYDLYLRALAAFYPITQEGLVEALRLLEQAIAIDPRYGPALSWAAMCHRRLAIDGWAKGNRCRAIDFARQALRVAQNDPGILANAAFVLAYFGEDIGAMIGLIDRALALNPSFAHGWYRSSVLRTWAGQPDLAIEHVETSLRLSPRERMGSPLSEMGTAYFFKRQFDEAVAKLLLSIQDQPGYTQSYRILAACYAHMGRLDEARAIVARLRIISPQVVPTDLPYRNPEDRELFLSGLRLAIGETP